MPVAWGSIAIGIPGWSLITGTSLLSRNSSAPAAMPFVVVLEEGILDGSVREEIWMSNAWYKG